MAAHSHHLWPDASFAGQVECWDDAARLADRKWDRVMGELWPEAQAEVAAELGTGQPDAIVFAGNTHDFLIRLWAAAPRRAAGPLARADHQRRIPQRPPPVRALGRKRRHRLEVLPSEPRRHAGRSGWRSGRARPTSSWSAR